MIRRRWRWNARAGSLRRCLPFSSDWWGRTSSYLGHPKLGIIYIVLTCTIIGGVFTGWGSIVEGVMYLTKSEEDFQRVYVQEGRAMF